MKQSLSRLFLVLVLAIAGTALAQEEMPGEGVTIEPAIPTWQSALPVQAIFKNLFEQLGYEVAEPVSLANPIFYQAVTQGDVDYWPSGWFPLHNAQLPENFRENASIVGTVVDNGALQGYLVSKAAAEEYDITGFEDFARPEVREAFDSDGDGLANMVGCPPGWGCYQTINFHMDTYDVMSENIEVTEAAYAAAFADALARYENGEPVLYYTWTPNFTVFELQPGEDVVWINVPEIVLSEAQAGFEKDALIVEGLEGAVTDPLKMGFVANDISTVANNEFLTANPAAAKILEVVAIPLPDISAMTARIRNGEDSEEAIAAMAQDWISNHQEMVDSWLETARAAAE